MIHKITANAVDVAKTSMLMKSGTDMGACMQLERGLRAPKQLPQKAVRTSSPMFLLS